jgi:C_GCAxxG_C_C family probable redox protein
MMSKNADDAVAMFLGGHNCAQSVLACCGAERGMPRELAVRVAQAFGGGIGRGGNLCGALTGALMVIGLEHAATGPADAQSKAKAYDLAVATMSEFSRRSGSLLCRDLIGCDLRTPEGAQQFKDSDAHHKVCAKLVRDAVEIVEQLLNTKETNA